MRGIILAGGSGTRLHPITLGYAIDSSKIGEELGWRPRYGDFERGLAAAVDWYRDHEDWWAPTKDATEAFYAELGQ